MRTLHHISGNAIKKVAKVEKVAFCPDTGSMTWHERLQRIIKERGLNRAEVQRQLGFSRNRIVQMEAGHEPGVLDAIKLCGFLGLSVEELFAGGRTDSPGRDKGGRKKQPTIMAWVISRGRFDGRSSLSLIGASASVDPEDFAGQKGLIPVVAPVAAGEPKEAHDKGFPVGMADAYVAFETDDPNAFGLSVDGASMEPDFRHGDIIIASPKLGHSNDTFRDGMIAVVIFGSERTATFKRVRFGAMGKRSEEPLDYVLEPLNLHFPPMRLKTREIAAIHPVIGLVRRGT